MDWIHYVMGPLVGAFIGWLTNGIAIKMLFRPLRPKYIGKWHVPFTPGIIPKERDRIAKSIGAVAETLVDEKAMKRTMLSDEMIGRLRTAVIGFIENQRRNDDTLRAVLERYTSPDTVDMVVEQGRSKLADLVYQRVSDTDFSRGVVVSIIDHIQQRMRESGIIGRVAASTGNLVRGAVATVVTTSVTPILKSSSRDIVYSIAGIEIGKLLDTPVSALVAGLGSSPEVLADRIIEVYRRTVTEQLPKALKEINIAGIVERSLDEMNIEDIEKMLLRVMDKELRAIVLLGAVLGFLMGMVNSFF